MIETREINPETNSVYGDIKNLNSFNTNRLAEMLLEDSKLKAIHKGTEEELQAIKNSECDHNIRVLRNGKKVCAKCNIDFYEGEI